MKSLHLGLKPLSPLLEQVFISLPQTVWQAVLLRIDPDYPLPSSCPRHGPSAATAISLLPRPPARGLIAPRREAPCRTPRLRRLPLALIDLELSNSIVFVQEFRTELRDHRSIAWSNVLLPANLQDFRCV